MAYGGGDGTLKTTISLGKNTSIVLRPFHTMKEQVSEERPLTGATNLIEHFGLASTYKKLCSKKVKEDLASFLPNIPGIHDGPGPINSTLRSVIEKPPIVGKLLLPLTGMQRAGFRLHEGPLPDRYRYVDTATTRKHKIEREESKRNNLSTPQETTVDSMMDTGLDAPQKKHKKKKRHEGSKERKKHKKEKKHKKQRDLKAAGS